MVCKGTGTAFFFLFLIIGLQLATADITLQVVPSDTGGWRLDITSTDLAENEPGSDFTGTYESTVSAEYMDITGTTGSTDAWEVRVKRTDRDWDDDMILSVRVTDDGSGGGSFSGGEEYRTVTETDRAFFSGTGDRTGVTIQFRITGISIADITMGHYSTDLTYTVVDTGQE